MEGNILKLEDLTYINKKLSYEEKEDIESQKRQMINYAGGCCEVCHKPFNFNIFPQMAHIVIKGNVKIFGAEVIHHPYNIKITCSKCNSGVIINTSKRQLLREHLEPIYQDLGVEDYKSHELWYSRV